jgi:hypothetical protein
VLPVLVVVDVALVPARVHLPQAAEALVADVARALLRLPLRAHVAVAEVVSITIQSRTSALDRAAFGRTQPARS